MTVSGWQTLGTVALVVFILIGLVHCFYLWPEPGPIVEQLQGYALSRLFLWFIGGVIIKLITSKIASSKESRDLSLNKRQEEIFKKTLEEEIKKHLR